MTTLSFERDGHDWPNRQASQFVETGVCRFHVQIMGQGPVVLLIHGTGGATHSWRGVVPFLAPHFTLVMPDLPGHGFSSLARFSSYSVDGLSRAMAILLKTLDLEPVLAIGHSAGAPIIARMALDQLIKPQALIGLNAAMRPLPVLPQRFFSTLAKAAALAPFIPNLFAKRASDPAVVRKLIEGTGSHLDADGLALYGRLGAHPSHVEAAFSMMANWDLTDTFDQLPRLKIPLHLIVGDADRAISPRDSELAARRAADGRVIRLAGLGHLAHEESPREVSDWILQIARDLGLIGSVQ
jgi:magnesium chelatase accessory protein